MELLLEEAQQADVTKGFLDILADEGVTAEEWQIIRAYPRIKATKPYWGDAVRASLAKLRSVSPYLFLSSLPNSGYTTANTSLEYRWNAREAEEARLKLIAQQYGGYATLSDLDVVDNVVAGMSAWQIGVVVSLVDALIWADIDPEEFLKEEPKSDAVEAYCKLLKHLSNIPELKLGDYYQGCVKKDGAKPHPIAVESWLRMPTTQKPKGPLTVRRMLLNPAILWDWDVDGTVYSIAPMHTPSLLKDLPEGNNVKKVNAGDGITTMTFLNAERYILSQIAAGTCPRIDMAGTQLCYSDDWPGCPRVDLVDGRAYLGSFRAAGAYESFGSFGCAME